MKRRILFVDDHPRILDALERMLHDQRDRWEMHFADSADLALEMIEDESYDAVVTDIKMPGKSGLELLAELKSDDRTQNVEVIVLTGLEDRRLKLHALELGAVDLLNKPVTKEDLLARLNSAIRQKSYKDDLLEQKRLLEQQLMQSQKMEVVGMLAAGAAHDLNNILAIIVGYSDVTEQLLGEIPKVQENLSKISSAGLRARKIVKQILEFSKQNEESNDRVELCSVIDECIELFQPSVLKNIRVKWDHPGMELSVPVDSTKLFQILMNLFINAVHAMETRGKLTVSVSRIEHDFEFSQNFENDLTRQYIKLGVSDTGKGMDEATMKHIFDPMFSTKRDTGGTGLGLNVVQRIVQSSGGEITVESSPGKGTTFTIFLPYVTAEVEMEKASDEEMVAAV